MNQIQRQLLEQLAEMLELHPEWRLGQMISNLTDRVKHANSPNEIAEGIWDIEDEELLASARDLIARRRQQLSQSAEPAA